jgi:hypothetical protein
MTKGERGRKFYAYSHVLHLLIAVGYIGYLHEREEGFAKETEELRRELMFLKQQ